MLMAGVLVVVAIYARVLGTEDVSTGGSDVADRAAATDVLGDAARRRPRAARTRRGPNVLQRWLDRYLLIIYTVLAVIYLMLPVALIILFSFNNPAGKTQLRLAGVHAQVLAEPARRRPACPRRSA